ncbi:thiolase family protein [Calderihabitans maritimus]|uniref:acetyl-CoA C-acetyltransferase n=1 Tax=Calderihabitans maritimus TaxID=1246530 RepID=A0A1Z5HT63_9FIRM|nr:thiolase family protein [Calderihabitans maritimus]GAW92628.1 acetyl-CoA acetyltransferase [Calderihabitans maritimus]
MGVREVVIVSAVRTPFGRYGGSLKNFDCYDLSALVIKEVLDRVNLPGELVEEIYWGAGDTAACKDVYTPVIARQALLKAGLPPETISCTLDKACVSGMSAVQLGYRAIRYGDIDVSIGGGVTTFSQEPLILRGLRFRGHRLGSVVLEDPLYELGYKDYNPVAVDAGEVALEHGIGRQEQDEWALRSHQRYGEAFSRHGFADEIMPVKLPDSGERGDVLRRDEQYRPDITLEKLAQLPTIYGSPTVTAGNAPGLNDGAAAILIMSREKAEKLGLKPLATIVSMANVALPPRLIAEAPAAAVNKVLKQAGLSLSDMNLIEINEAFAAVTLVSSKILAGEDKNRMVKLQERINVNGGAIAIGHANTASGARILMTLVYELARRGGGYGVAAICGGLAQGEAAIVKV